jgi:hypothetical protein
MAEMRAKGSPGGEWFGPSAPKNQAEDAHATDYCTDNFGSHFSWHIFVFGANDARSADRISAKGEA